MKFFPLLIFILMPVSLFGLYGLSYNSYSLVTFDNGIYNNPAALNSINKQGIAIMENNLGDNFYNFNLSYAYRFNQFITGLNLNYKYSQEYTILDNFGNPEGNFRYNFMKINAAVASTVNFLDISDLYYGLRINLERESAKDYSGTGILADFGLIYNLTLLKNNFIDQIGCHLILEDIGKNINDVNTFNLVIGLLGYFPLVKEATHILAGISIKTYFNSSLSDNDIYAFSLGFKQSLSKISQNLQGYNFMINLTYNYNSLYKSIGDVTGLEYGLYIENQSFGFGYDCLFNSLSGNDYSFSFYIKF